MTELEMQDVHGTDWDYLIVLDACRYDYFEEHYDEFLEGELKKQRSKGTQTPEWLRKTFTTRYNYKYISANAFANSLGMGMDELMGEDYGSDWTASRKFTEIMDSWQKDWSDEVHTVPPENITDTAIEKANPKTVIHYIQPHRPYISSPVEEKNLNILKNNVQQNEETDEEVYDKASLKRRIIEKTRPAWNKFFWKLSYRTRWKIKDLLGLENPHWGSLVTEIGEEKVHEYYQKDLRMALEQVKRLVKELDGKVIVTADHGEALGEHNDWGHSENSNNPYMYTVPWLEVKGVKD